MQYYLKARFQFNKNQFADLMMISGIGATLTMITIRYEYVGMVQGCLSGISSLANIISPLVSSPLTALFLSHDAPYYFPGFSLMCLGLALMAAFFQSLMIRSVPPIVVGETSSNHCTETLA
ncbi:hypothetical protein Lalb_Chr21g0306981 [Lupinus albus]|uniref:Uncharacterized protein n=1 Tax=Lupinus albus TaxID=3870 RepID=A0A6A4NEP7_LUPAL|nr:hypothetical protein Lalb_Chr21g0306981 [Lupinus albus]